MISLVMMSDLSGIAAPHLIRSLVEEELGVGSLRIWRYPTDDLINLVLGSEL